MDEQVLEEIQFHTETVESDANSPLHLIREKEMEISGHVLAAKKEAEEIVARARQEAVRVVRESEIEGERLAKEREKVTSAQIESQAKVIADDTQVEIGKLEKIIDERLDAGVEFVVDAVLKSER